MTIPVSTDAFHPDAISQETRAINSALALRMATAPVAGDLSSLRRQFAQGQGPIPASPRSPQARTINIPTGGGGLSLRIYAPSQPRGVYLHIHGGAWMLGTAEMWDGDFERMAGQAGLASVSVEYRLAPEHPYPAAVDDCEAAALWLIARAPTLFGTGKLVIGGESAGAHLAVLTLLRLRERGMHDAFRAANLLFGCFDLSLTPSAMQADSSLVLNRALLVNASAAFRGEMDARDPRVSPLYADLAGLPPALFTVGSLDPLLDDSLLMHTRWLAVGNAAQLAVYPGGLHGFTSFEGQLAAEANARAEDFLRRALD